MGSLNVVTELIDRHRSGEDQNVVGAGLNLHAIGVAQPEPLLGDLGDLVAARLISYSWSSRLPLMS